MRLPTVCVVNPADPEGPGMYINESDFDARVHHLHGAPGETSTLVSVSPLKRIADSMRDGTAVFINANSEITPREAQPVGGSRIAAADDLRVAKGPGGKWYVWRGKQIVSGRLDSEDAATDALRNMREPVA